MWVIAKPGTKFNSLNDFKGKRIACLKFPSNSVTSPTFAMKKLAGMDPKSAGVEFVEGPPGSLLVQSATGVLTSVWFLSGMPASPPATRIAGRLRVCRTFGPILLTSLMVQEDYLKSNADTVQRTAMPSRRP